MQRMILLGMALLAILVPYAIGQEAPLRELANEQGLWFGSAANGAIERDARYADVLAREFSMLTPENELKFHVTHPEAGQFDFRRGDALVSFAEANDMRVRGHALIWHQSQPDWLDERDWTRDTLLKQMRSHIEGVAGHYKERLYAWDVVNEYFDSEGGVRESLWSETIGPDFMAEAHRMAREVDPDVKLFVNDYGNHSINEKSDGMYRWVKKALADGVPVDGVGFQMHLRNEDDLDTESVAANFRRFAELGLEIHVTELDVRIRQPVSDEELQRQAQRYGDVLRLCLDEPAVTALVVWGFSDRYSWIPHFYEGYGSALIFDESFEPKPAYHRLTEILRSTP